MKNKTHIILFIVALCLKFYTAEASYMPASIQGKIKAVNKSGLMSISGILMIDTFSIASGTPTLQLGTYIRNNGCTKAASYTATGYRSAATVANGPQVCISGFTDTTISLVISQQNTATVTILGISVLSGTPIIVVPDPTNVKIVLSAYLY